MRKVRNPRNCSYKHHCFLPSLMFLSLKLDIGGHEPTIKHNTSSWSYNLLLGQSNKGQQRTCKNNQEQNIKRETKYITHHNLNIKHNLATIEELHRCLDHVGQLTRTKK